MARRTTTVNRVVRVLAAADLSNLSDRELLARFIADGDQTAFAAVAARHTGMVLGVCRRTLAPTDAEDACQAVFLLLAEKAAGTRWQSSAAGWLYSTARRVARNARVAADRRARRESRAAVPELVSPMDSMTGRELAAALDEELGRLSPRYRDPLVLCYLEGLTQDEAAARLGVPTETLKSQLKRGRKKLADALSARGCELGIALLAVVASAATASAHLAKLIQAAGSGSPSAPAIAFARASTASPVFAHVKSVMLAATLAAAALGVGASLVPPMSAQPTPPKPTARAEVEKVEAPAVAQVGATRFRASAPIGDARYSADGKRIVGYASGTIYVWNPVDGSLVRSIDTKLQPLDDPARRDRHVMGFAVHPKKPLVAIGGTRDLAAPNKNANAVLQVWDFESGQRLGELAALSNLKVLAWTPDGERLLGRATTGIDPKTTGVLLVGDILLSSRTMKSYWLPALSGGQYAPQMLPLPGNDEVILWQNGGLPTVFSLKTTTWRAIDYKAKIPSGLAVSPDGKTLAVTATDAMALLDLPGGKTLHQLPILRDGWEKPRPLFSPDSRTVFVWDHRPMAYDVATGKEKWRASFRTYHTAVVKLSDISPDGKVLLCRHGHRLLRLDAATGKELDPPDDPSMPGDVIWSPDGRKLFTRTERHDRTWTAWDAKTGQRLYHLQPTGVVPDDNWKLMPDLFFIHDDKEIVAGIDRDESNERSGTKELVVFDTETGKCLRRLGEPLPDETFRWKHLIGVAPDGSKVLMQAFGVERGPGVAADGDEDHFRTVWWDPVNNKVTGQFDVAGYRMDSPQHFSPYVVMLKLDIPDPNGPNMYRKADTAKIRCYSVADGTIVHQWTTGFNMIDVDRIQGNFLLAAGYDSKWMTRDRTLTYTQQAPVVHELWELPSRDRVRLFETEKPATAALGPDGRFVLRVRDDGNVDVYEPFVLKKAIETLKPSARPMKFEFSADGRRVAASLADTSVVLWETAPWLRQIDEQIAAAVPNKLDSLWVELASDPASGLRAAWLIAAAGDRGIALLKSKVSARPVPDARAVGGLIADLDSSRFAVREKAEADLRDLGSQAEPFLKRSLRGPVSAEAGKRIEDLLAAIRTGKLSASQIREVRAVQALTWMNTPAANALLAEWAKGDPTAALTRAAKHTP
jgi:RNA polymerase sigma factor (sigma-70 family)